MRILLFDIDGTLLLTNGGGTRAISQALAEEFGVHEPKTDVDYRGRTDSSLLRELLSINDLHPSSNNFRQLSQAYSERLPDVLAEHGGEILPGVLQLLSLLASHSDIACYVMTGNLKRTATQKLSHFGLDSHFRGVFGGDHDEDRRHLAQRTARALAQKYGPQSTESLYVIGDTPEDIRCGDAIGASVLAVCTGSFTRDELEATGAHHVHEDMSDVGIIYRKLIDVPGETDGERQ